MKLSIDNPCHKEWNKMLPNQTGAFCLSCTKNVIDFTSKTIDEIKIFFIEKPIKEQVCGLFEEQQFTALAFDDFFNRFMKWKYFQKTALIVFFVFGLSLFGKAQNIPIEVPVVTMGTVSHVPDSTKKTPKKEKKHKQDKTKGKHNSTKPKSKEEPKIMGDIMVEEKK